jgi:transcriptional regulator with XRE-family HTH domain
MSVGESASARDTAKLIELVKLEQRTFGAKICMVRAVLGWSQSELALRAGLTPRAVHKRERGDTEPRRVTVHVIEAAWREEGLDFEEMGDGSFRVAVRRPLLVQPRSRPDKQTQAAQLAVPHAS